MKTGTLLLLGVAALAVIEYSNLGIAGATVQFLFQGVQVNSLSDIEVTMLVQNVSNGNIVLNSMTLDLTVNGNELGNAAVFPSSPIVVQSNSQQPVVIRVTPNLLTLPSAIMSLVQSNQLNSLIFKADGTANVNNIPMPVHVTLNESA